MSLVLMDVNIMNSYCRNMIEWVKIWSSMCITLDGQNRLGPQSVRATSVPLSRSSLFAEGGWKGNGDERWRDESRDTKDDEKEGRTDEWGDFSSRPHKHGRAIAPPLDSWLIKCNGHWHVRVSSLSWEQPATEATWAVSAAESASKELF